MVSRELEAEGEKKDLNAVVTTQAALDAYTAAWSGDLAVLRNHKNVCDALIEDSKSKEYVVRNSAIKHLLEITLRVQDFIYGVQQGGTLDNLFGGLDAKTIVLLKELVETVAKNTKVIEATTATDASP